MDRDRFVKELLAAGVAAPDKVEQADSIAKGKGVPLERILVQNFGAPEEAVYRALAKAAGLAFVDLAKQRVDPATVAKVPKNVLEENQALPVVVKDGRLFVAIDDPLRTFVADNFAFVTSMEVRCCLATPGALKDALRRAAGGDTTGVRTGPADQGKSAAADDTEGPIIRLVHKMIEDALVARASDVHVEPFERRVRVRYRVDGVLREAASHEITIQGALTSRVKIMANLDIAERRKPQDGRIQFRAKGRDIDIRTSVLPGNHGETIVMRLLDKEQNLLSLEGLGFHADDYAWFRRILKRPNGLFLVTGPTGSGKTTTLYAALTELNRPDVKIITAEDPVEYHLRGINQCQVKIQIELTFARILRAMLRQAPNIILVGEIRDRETAEIAIQAALTGHLVFSTLHTNDSVSAITRLVDMGVKPFLVAASLQAVMAQRLLRVLCAQCKEAYQAEASELRSLGIKPEAMAGKQIYRGKGCDQCEGTGFRGRKGIFELLEVDSTLREMCFKGEPLARIREYARSSGGMSTLGEDGIRKVLAGTTSIAEVLRVTVA